MRVRENERVSVRENDCVSVSVCLRVRLRVYACVCEHMSVFIYISIQQTLIYPIQSPTYLCTCTLHSNLYFLSLPPPPASDPGWGRQVQLGS